ncbi:MAG: hypothetical protein J6S67_00795 [Methanobrevibacter sp.]|nr:hypothetical protein [Methanobrevibacter sp.]
MYFYVIETQTGESGSTNTFVYKDRADAEAKYHEVLMYASKSTVRRHGCMIMTEDLFILKSEVYNHDPAPVTDD